MFKKHREKQQEFEFEEQDMLEINTVNHSTSDLDETEIHVRVMSEKSSVFELLRKEKKGLLVLAPDFQRKNVWGTKQRSELIESILIGIPIPLIYLFEDEDGIRQVVDGKQRISTLKSFVNDEFALKNLELLPKLTNKVFSEIDPLYQAILEDYQFYCHVLQPPTPEEIKIKIFERVNRGGLELNRQEMRFALNQGPITKLLFELADTDAFKNATGKGVNYERMKDHYFLLRFIAFYLLKKNLLPEKLTYNSNMDSFLSLVMKFVNKQAAPDLIAQIKQDCIAGLINCKAYLGDDAFRFQPKKEQASCVDIQGKLFEDSPRRPMSMGLFEMLVFAFIDIPYNEKQQEKVKNIVEIKKAKIEKNNYFSGAVDTANMVEKRFQIAQQIIEKIQE